MAKKVAKPKRPNRWVIALLAIMIALFFSAMVRMAVSGSIALLLFLWQLWILSLFSGLLMKYLHQFGVGGVEWSKRLKTGYIAAFALTLVLTVPLAFLGLSEHSE